jgi:acyl-CoA thioesterase
MTLKDFLNEGDKFAKYIGIQLTEVKPGTAKATMTVTENHMNAGNICQGGALFTLADLVFAALVNQGENMAFAINSTIYYHVSAKLGDVLTAEGHFTSRHPKIPAAQVVVTDQNGNIIATFHAQGYTKRMPAPFSGLE